MTTTEASEITAGAVAEFVCCAIPGEVVRHGTELANCQSFESAVAVFVNAGKPQAEAIRLAIAGAPKLHEEYRQRGGPLPFLDAELSNCADFHGAVRVLQSRGMTRPNAVRHAMTHLPNLHAKYIERGGAF